MRVSVTVAGYAGGVGPAVSRLVLEPGRALLAVIPDIRLRARTLLHPVGGRRTLLPPDLGRVQLKVHHVTLARLVVSSPYFNSRQVLEQRHELEVG